MAHSMAGVKKAMDYWWLLLLTGIALVSMGIWVFISPEDAYISLSVLFGVCILFVGVFELLFALSARRSLHTWGWMVASGIFDIVVGCFILAYPYMTTTVLPYVLGLWLLFRGFSAIGFAFDMRRYGADAWRWLLVIAIAIIVFGILVLSVPTLGLLHIVIWTAASFIFLGMFRIFLAMNLRRLKEELD
jgi:uncharacterized membrane protein HdeD (DUF308 family)